MSKFTLTVRVLLLAFGLACALASQAQAQETEPNNTCLAPQDMGVVSLPAVVFGSLDSTPEVPDIDFFRFEATPGSLILADLEGTTTGVGTLNDPFVGVFDSGCALLNLNDDGGSGLNSRLSFEVPTDGVFIVAATNCCDGSFIGGGIGTYRLTLGPLQMIQSIGGRLVNDMTDDPLPGADLPYASVQLLRCNEDGCYEFVNFQQSDAEGRFLFVSDQSGAPLTVGTYQLSAYAQGFENMISEPFVATEGEARDVGDLRLVPLQIIGSISGRLVNALDNRPLSGGSPPYAYLILNRCFDYGCYTVASAGPDELGRFSIVGAYYNLGPGTYQIIAYGENYYESISALFNVAEFENLDIGDLPMTPFPIQFGPIQGCQIPTGGGLCEYGVEVLNQGPGRYRGAAWSNVEFYAPPSYRVVRFQVGRNGANHAEPQKLKLRRGRSEMLTFQLDVPGSVPDGAFICATIAVGLKPTPHFNSQGEAYGFCVTKLAGNITVLPEKEGRMRLKEMKSRDRESTQDLRSRKDPHR